MYHFTGYIPNATTGQPLFGAMVKMFDMAGDEQTLFIDDNGTVAPLVLSDENGKVDCWLPAGTYDVIFYYNGEPVSTAEKQQFVVDQQVNIDEAFTEATTFTQLASEPVERTTTDKARERYTVEDIALPVPDNVGRRAQLRSAIGGIATRALGKSLAMPRDYKVSAGAVWGNPSVSDPEPAAIPVTLSNALISGEGAGTIAVDTPDKSIFHFKSSNTAPANAFTSQASGEAGTSAGQYFSYADGAGGYIYAERTASGSRPVGGTIEANRPRNIVLRDFAALVQLPSGYPAHAGLTDDYFAVRFEAAENCRAENLNFPAPELALTFQFAQSDVYAKANAFDAATAVSPGGDSISVLAHELVTGERVQIRKNGVATAPTGLVIGTIYYAIVIDANTVKLATTRDNALAGTAIDITAAGAGQLTLTNFRRGSFRNISKNCTANNVRFMFMQLFGEQGGIHTGHTATGQAADGFSRAAAHALRMIGYPFAPNERNRVTDHTFSRFSNGLSVQQWVRNNTVSLTANDCANGISVNRAADTALSMGDYTAAEGCPVNNNFTLNAVDCDVGVNDLGGSYNVYDVNIAGAKQKGIYLDPNGVSGLGVGNTYRGTIRVDGTHGADIRGPETTVDLDIVGGGAGATSYGLLCSADGLRGSVRVSNCAEGVRISGNKAHLRVRALNNTTDLVISGSNNVIECDVDGNVTIGTGGGTGENTKLSGRVGGTITLTGSPAGVDLSGIRGRRRVMRFTGQVTNASGLVTLTHNLGLPNTATAEVIASSPSGHKASVTGAANNSTTLLITTKAGADVVSATGLIIDLIVEAL